MGLRHRLWKLYLVVLADTLSDLAGIIGEIEIQAETMGSRSRPSSRDAGAESSVYLRATVRELAERARNHIDTARERTIPDPRPTAASVRGSSDPSLGERGTAELAAALSDPGDEQKVGRVVDGGTGLAPTPSDRDGARRRGTKAAKTLHRYNGEAFGAIRASRSVSSEGRS